MPAAVLAGVLALGLGLRLWGINFGLPYTYAPDEPTYLQTALRILKTGDLNPHWWYYPSLMFYLNAAALFAYFVYGRLVGHFATLADLPGPEVITMGAGKLALPTEFLVTRALVALFSGAGIAVVYLIARRLHPNRWVAVLVALLVAVSPTVVDNSHRMGPDIFALFFSLASFLFALEIAEKASLRSYVLAGACAGLAIASKYNAGLILIPLVVAHFSHYGLGGWRRIQIYVAIGAVVLAFLVGTPFALLDFRGFWEGVRFQVFSYSAEGHAGQEGDALGWYLSYLWSVEGWFPALGVLGGVAALTSRSKKQWIVTIYPLVYFGFVSLFLVRNPRTIMQIIPYLALLAALFVARVYEWSASLLQVRRPLALGGAIVLCGWLVIQSGQGSLAGDLRLTAPDAREEARVWIEQHLPPGSRVAVEAYSPYVDTGRYAVQGFYSMVDNAPEWFEQNGFEYLVFSYGAYGRYYEDSSRYAEWVNRYEDMFSRFEEIARFGGNQIRIYRTDVSGLPSHRVGAQFGTYGPLLEFVGYDQGSQDDPLAVTLYWRSMQELRNPLTLTVRLLDRTDQEVGHSTGDLFSRLAPGDRWPGGVVSVPWKIPAPSNVRPGLYRLELDVDAGGIGRLAVLSPERKAVSDKLFIGPVKIPEPHPSEDDLAAALPVYGTFGNALSLEGYAADPLIVRLGDSIDIALYWRARQRMEKDYTVFLHLLDPSGKLCTQVDSQPFGGAYPTSIWDADEQVADHVRLTVPDGSAPGIYALEVGVYEYPSLKRLEVLGEDGKNEGDRLILSSLVQVIR